jgi:hypothetical protein
VVRTWKEAVVADFEVLSGHSDGGTEECTKTLSQDQSGTEVKCQRYTDLAERLRGQTRSHPRGSTSCDSVM